MISPLFIYLKCGSRLCWLTVRRFSSRNFRMLLFLLTSCNTFLPIQIPLRISAPFSHSRMPTYMSFHVVVESAHFSNQLKLLTIIVRWIITVLQSFSRINITNKDKLYSFNYLFGLLILLLYFHEKDLTLQVMRMNTKNKYLFI